mmetsp:Transcript_99878/g.279726  ORF Transcript_99878/g.279726 Transcript_99878/m.279726 type:complete len:834 (-) Transcript_99878:66-2567(-)
MAQVDLWFLAAEALERAPSDQDGEVSDAAEHGASAASLLRTAQRRAPGRIARIAGAAVVGVAVLTAATSSFRGRVAGSGPVSGAADSAMQLSSEGRCHTATEGSSCWDSVMWARTSGISNHPEWYEGACSGLSSLSLFEEFQGCVYKLNSTACPLPCNPSGSAFLQELAGHTHHDSKLHASAEIVDPCHIAQLGERCYTQVLLAMKLHPDKFATFNEYQAALHDERDDDSCPQPCGCSTAEVGEECYKNVRWVMEQGIRLHPDWYVGLSAKSTPYEVQAFLQYYGRGMCALPCHDIDPTTVDRDTVLQAAKAQRAKMQEKKAEDAKRAEEEQMERQKQREAEAARSEREVRARRKAAMQQEKYRHELPPWKRGVAAEVPEEEAPDAADVAQEDAPDVAVEDADTDESAEDLSGDEAEKRKFLKALEAQFKLVESKGDKGLGDASDASALDEDAEEADADPVPEEKPQLPKRHHAEEHHSEETCVAVTKGHKCYKDVMYAMQHGIYEHPEWYPHLSPTSSFEEFQMLLSTKQAIKCPKPCACHTTRIGEECHKNIKWVLGKGVRRHPDWYEGLEPHSRFEEAQARLVEDKATKCLRPCAPKVWSSPSLFCFSVFRSHGYEVDLVTAQLEKNAGIFSCDEFAVLSDRKLPLIRGVETLMIPPCEKVGVSKDGTAANTLIFMQAWSVIYNDVRWQAHDWLIKADPDAVLLSDRLRNKLRPHTGQDVYLKNCNLYSGPAWPMMFGSLEAISIKAIERYFEGAERCKKELEWHAWGEDLFMGNCLTLLGSSAAFDSTIIGDNVCKGANCGDGVTAVYHPFKSKEKWFACYEQALAAHR